MGLFTKLKKNREKEDIKHLMTNSLYDILIFTIIFLIVFILIRIFLRMILNVSTTVPIVSEYRDAVDYTFNNLVYIAITSIILNIGNFLIFISTVVNCFKKKLLNKKNYKPYTYFIVTSILVLSALSGILLIIISNNSLICGGITCRITDLSFYTYELNLYKRLYLGLVLNNAIWTLVTIIICSYTIKYLYNKKILIKETGKSKNIISRIFSKKKKQRSKN